MLSLTCQSLSCLSPLEALVCTKLRLLPDNSEEKTRLVTFRKNGVFLVQIEQAFVAANRDISFHYVEIYYT